MSSGPPGSTPEPSSSRNAVLLAGGFFLLGLALALLLFGQPLLGRIMPGPTADLPQIPAGAGDGQAGALPAGPLIVGDQAYDFTLADVDGNTVALADLQGRPLVLNFWATWCAPCRLEMPHLQRAYEAHADDGLLILAINQQEQPDQVRAFFDELGLSFTPLLDSDGDVGRTYGALGLPSTYFVNRAGTITAVHAGILSPEQIDGYLEPILR